MDAEVLKNVEKRMQILARTKILEEKTLWIGPANDIAVYLFEWLQKHFYHVGGVFSSEKRLFGQSLMGMPICRAEELLIPYRKNGIILLTDSSDHYLNHKLDILEYYYNVQRYVVTEPVVSMPLYARMKQQLKQKIWRNSLQGVHFCYQGKKVYHDLRKQTQQKKLLLFPYRSIGDMYILGVYKRAGNERFTAGSQLVVAGEICKKVAQQMGFRKVIAIAQEDMYALIRLVDACREKLPDVEILHYNYSFPGIAADLSNQYRINFYQNYQYLVFGKEYKGLFRVEENRKDAVAYCQKHKICKGKSVILSPYAKSILSVPLVFWETLAGLLQKAGYQVYTNCGGKQELPVIGTKKICFPIEIANGVVEYAGYFIGLRSGLCDLISCAECCKVIIYPKSRNVNMSIRDFYTFENLTCADTIQEFECSLIPKKEEAEKIVAYIQSLENYEKDHTIL